MDRIIKSITKILGEFLFELGRANDPYRLYYMLDRLISTLEGEKTHTKYMVDDLEKLGD